MKWHMWEDYTEFHDAAIASRDIDPVYPVLEHIGDAEGWDAESRARVVLIHVGYYDLGSALTAAELHLDKGVPLSELPVDLPCATERRNHRQPAKLRRHLQSLDAYLDAYGSVDGWLARPGLDPRDAFEEAAKALAQVWGNGRWSCYKTVEMLWKVCGWPLQADTLAMEGSSGPAAGLRLLLGEGVKPTEELGQRLVQALAAHGHDATPEQVETTLCDFHSMVEGGYYVGHDIDQMQTQLLRAAPGHLVAAAWRARAATLPNQYLGELHDWSGPDRERKRVFRETGQVVLR